MKQFLGLKKRANTQINYTESQEEHDALQTAHPDHSNFDETLFDFKLHHESPKHTEVLIAQATFKSDGMPVPLHCTWYTSKGKEFVQIPDVITSCYQPTIEDIGKKIIVHGVPASDLQKYEGMPLFAETVSLVCDPAVEQQVAQKLEKDEVEFTAVIVNKKPQTIVVFPNKVQLAADTEINYSDLSYSVVAAVNNLVHVNTFVVQFQDNVQRDVFCFCLKHMLREFERDPSRLSQSDFFKQKQKLFQAQIQQLESQIAELEEKQTEIQKQNAELESLSQEKQSQVDEVAAQVQNSSDRLSDLQKDLDQVRERCQFFETEQRQFDHQNCQLSAQLSQLKVPKRSEFTQTEADEYCRLLREYDELQSQVSHLQAETQDKLSHQSQSSLEDTCTTVISYYQPDDTFLTEQDSIDTCLVANNSSQFIQQSSLASLIEDNNQTKLALASKQSQITQYLAMVSEYEESLTQEIQMTSTLQMAVDALTSSQTISLFASKNCQKMQTLVKHLTIQVAQQAIEIVQLRKVNDDLS